MSHPYEPLPRDGFRRLVFYGGPAIAYAALIYFLSSLSRFGDEIQIFSFQDKVAHFLEYLLFGVLICRWFSAGTPEGGKNRALMMAMGVGLCYGLSDEWHQSFVPGRDASLWDALFDALGVVAGTSAYRWLGRRFVSRLETRRSF
jgi:VanZ family protein